MDTQVLNAKLYSQLSNIQILVIGAGGLGIEIIKNLVNCGATQIYIIDLDIIERSNMNRIYLFKDKHNGMKKVDVVKEEFEALTLDPNSKIPKVKINADYGNILDDSKYNLAFYKQFQIIFSAVDHIPARYHISAMCIKANVPLFHGGTQKYAGQAISQIKGKFQCKNCQGIRNPGADAVTMCSARQIPTQNQHAIAWAMEIQQNILQENDHKVQTLQIQKIFQKENLSQDQRVEEVFNLLFNDQVKEIAKNKDQVRPIMFAQNCQQSEIEKEIITIKNQRIKAKKESLQIWNAQECKQLFIELLDGEKLEEMRKNMKYLKENSNSEGEQSIKVKNQLQIYKSKLVCVLSNLRIYNFYNLKGHELQYVSQFEVESMVNKIIPMTASANSTVAGILVTESLKCLKQQIDKMKIVWISDNCQEPLFAAELSKPNPNCIICSPNNEQSTVSLDISIEMNLEQFLATLRIHYGMSQISLFIGQYQIKQNKENLEQKIQDLCIDLLDLHEKPLNCTVSVENQDNEKFYDFELFFKQMNSINEVRTHIEQYF